MFTRFCINIDVALNIGKNHHPGRRLQSHKIRTLVRAVPIPILRITIRKNFKNSTLGSASVASSSLNQDWSEIGRNNKPISNSFPKSNHQNKPYLAGKSRVNITSESDGINNVETEEQVIVTNKTPENHNNCNSDGVNPMNNQINQLEQTNPIFKDNEEFQADLAEMFNQNYILNSTLPAEMELPSFVMAELNNNNSLPNT
ncbi:hypothetical protein V2J09_017693 [Rumex salicifolius]